jgi:hypothetical protein
MKKIFLVTMTSASFFAVISQYYIMVSRANLNVFESTIRFFSYFTILSNLLIAFYSLFMIIKKPKKLNNALSKTGVITAIAIYITIVCLVYQITLRPYWNPTGFQKVIDEILHSLIPFLFIFYWLLYEKKAEIKFSLIPKWTIFPLTYLGIILIRGIFSNFYPYYFLNIVEFGYLKVFINVSFLIIFFLIMSFLYVLILKLISKSKTSLKQND